MTTPRVSASITLLARKTQARIEAKLAFVQTERDLYRLHGRHPGRHLDEDDRRRLARLGKDVGWGKLGKLATVVSVKTLRRWYRDLIAPPADHAGGKSRTSVETEALVVRLAVENSWGNDAWGRKRIKGEMTKLGTKLSASTVRRILHRHGILPAPKRGAVHDEPLAVVGAEIAPGDVAMDYLTCQAIDRGVLVTMYVLIAIHLATRNVTVAGMSAHPCADSAGFATKLAAADGFLRQAGANRIILDHDNNYSAEFAQVLTEAGYTLAQTTPHQPWENGFAERMVRTLKDGLLRKIVIADVAGLEAACAVFLAHYHDERPHQGLGNVLINPPATPPPSVGKVIRHDRLGGLIHHYAREVA